MSGKNVEKRKTDAVVIQEIVDTLDPDENMEGTEPRFPEIKIVHQSQLFTMPDENNVKDFKGVIIDSNRINAYWEKKISEGGSGNIPDCFSFNGLTPASDEIKAETCSECSLNRWKSDPDGGRGKACKNGRRVHIIVNGGGIPYRLTLPPTSLRSFDDYMVKLTEAKMNRIAVVTEFFLSKEANKEGTAYSQINFKKAENVTDPKQLRDMIQLKKNAQEQMRGESIIADEVHTGTEPY